MIEVRITGMDMDEVLATMKKTMPATKAEPAPTVDELLKGMSLQELVSVVTVRADDENYDLVLTRRGVSQAEQKKAEAKAKLRGDLVESLKELGAKPPIQDPAIVHEQPADSVVQQAPVPVEDSEPAKKKRKPKADETPAERKNRCIETMKKLYKTNKEAVDDIARKFAKGDTRRFALMPEEEFEAVARALEALA